MQRVVSGPFLNGTEAMSKELTGTTFAGRLLGRRLGRLNDFVRNVEKFPYYYGRFIPFKGINQ